MGFSKASRHLASNNFKAVTIYFSLGSVPLTSIGLLQQIRSTHVFKALQDWTVYIDMNYLLFLWKLYQKKTSAGNRNRVRVGRRRPAFAREDSRVYLFAGGWSDFFSYIFIIKIVKYRHLPSSDTRHGQLNKHTAPFAFLCIISTLKIEKRDKDDSEPL